MNDIWFRVCQELNKVGTPCAFADVDGGLEAVQSRAPNRRRPPSTTLPFAVNLLHSMCRQPALLHGPEISFVALFSHIQTRCGGKKNKYLFAKAAVSTIECRTKKEKRTMGQTRSEYVPCVISRGVSQDLLVQMINPLWGREDTSSQRDTPKKICKGSHCEKRTYSALSCVIFCHWHAN